MLTITRKIAILLLVSICSIAVANADNARHYGFKQINNAQGLSSCYIKATAQDSNGFIWIGTKNGLFRYDGISIRPFQCRDNAAKRENNNIGAIYEDADHKLWIGTDRGVYILDPRTEQCKFLDIVSPHGVMVEDWVQTIQGDTEGNIWILVPNQGAFKYAKDKIRYYSVTNHNGDKEKLPLSLLATSTGTIIVGTNNQGLYFYDRQNDAFRKMGVGTTQYKALDNIICQYLDELPDGRIAIATRQCDVFTIDPATSSLSHTSLSGGGELFTYALKIVGDEIWVGTTNGVQTININNGNEFAINQSTMGNSSLSDNTITSLMVDRDNNVWAGTMFGGISYIQRSGLIFEKYGCDDSRRGLTSDHVRGVTCSADGKIWIGTEANGFNILDPRTGNVSRHASSNPNNKLIFYMQAIGNQVYAGCLKGGCMVMDLDGNVRESIGTNLLKTVSDVYSVFRDDAGNLWIGASWGLYRKKHDESDFKQIEDVGYSWIYEIIQDTKGIIWIASMGGSIWSYNPITETYKHYAYDEAHSNGLCSNSVSSITEDSKGRLWFSTDRGGLALFNPSTDTFTTYNTANGLPDDTVYDVVEDNSGNLWFGTNSGLVRFDPETGNVKTYFCRDLQFYYNSATKTADGRIYMGGIDGLLVFNPESDAKTAHGGEIYFTDFRLTGANANRPMPLKQSIIYCDKIDLDSDCCDFSLTIGSPTYSAHGNEQFQYRLLPATEQWSMVSDPSNLSFAGLSPGDYTLEVRRLNDNDNIRRLGITVPAPWFQTWWADCLYALFVISMIVISWYYYRKRQLQKLAEKEELMTIEKGQELYKKKLQFFTEIAHEIRTPLTLIGTPLEAIEEIGVKDTRIQRYLKVIRQNTSRLLDLTGQILDFQKMDSDFRTLKFETVDINSLVQATIDRFEITISTRNKELVCKLPEHQILARVDKEALTKILSNLMNNALKYSDKFIGVTLDATDESFIVSVKSDGEKIAGDNRYKIFEPFFQATNRADNGGVGIGLSLCRTLAHFHGGTIDLADDDEPGTNTFVLTLPINDNVEDTEMNASPSMTEYVLEDESPMKTNDSSYSLLLVDDNDEMREFLYDQLSQDFVVETATDGQDALEKLKDHKFDIIVTDIMMPVMDGYELCKAVKDNPNLSPIPVVFLTAKNDIESKVRALECGGESYIEKPFSIKYFRQQIRSILDNRRHERKAFLNNPFFTVDNMKINKADEEFMNKALKLINDNISNEDFNVESMADAICMSRSSLLRKIKSLFNLSPVELIRIIRLKKAAELIQDGKYRMGDICFMVGINSQSYFTRLFYKQFGITPKAFEKQCQEKMSRNDNSQHTDTEITIE